MEKLPDGLKNKCCFIFKLKTGLKLIMAHDCVYLFIYLIYTIIAGLWKANIDRLEKLINSARDSGLYDGNNFDKDKKDAIKFFEQVVDLYIAMSVLFMVFVIIPRIVMFSYMRCSKKDTSRRRLAFLVRLVTYGIAILFELIGIIGISVITSKGKGLVKPLTGGLIRYWIHAIIVTIFIDGFFVFIYYRYYLKGTNKKVGAQPLPDNSQIS